MIEKIKWVSSLEKVFPDREPKGAEWEKAPSFLVGEVFSLQCAFWASKDMAGTAGVELSGPFAEYVRVREVCTVPSRFSGRLLEKEDSYLYAPGLYPDLLRELREERVRIYPGQWHALWLTVECGGEMAGEVPGGQAWRASDGNTREESGQENAEGKGELPFGVHELELKLTPDVGETVRTSLELELVPVSLPEQTLLHTEWFHTDCLADYYRVEPWSQEHWRIVECFLAHYAKMGMNMVLVPVLTPPLDTAVGGERTTVQLVEIREEAEGVFRFGFERLERYVELCRRAGIRCLEISHLFTQWGACAAPKVMVWRDGVQVRRFGWDTPSDSPEYLGFLEQFLHALTEKLTRWGWEGKVFFHLSDEPREEALERYRFLREKVTGWIAPYPVMDALSDYAFYESGAVDRAVPSMDSLPLFAAKGAEPLWTYYCSGQCKGTPNRFLAMPSCQVRVLGVLLYVYRAEGFLHWGYNFYNSALSLEHIDPYAVTDAGGVFPSGDSFLVYPGPEGKPEDSLRMLLMLEAMQDLRALQLLESLQGRESVMELLRREAGMELTAVDWPRDAAFLPGLREKVNGALAVLAPC